MTQHRISMCPHCGQPLDGIADASGVRCRSCAALVSPTPQDPTPPGKPRRLGYVIAVLVSTVICMLLILALIVVTGINLLRG